MNDQQTLYFIIGLIIFLVMVIIWALYKGKNADGAIVHGHDDSHHDDAETEEDQHSAPVVAPVPPAPEKNISYKDIVDGKEESAAQTAPAKAQATETARAKPDIAQAVGEPDNLRQIKGVGPKLDNLLKDLGITRFDQIAAWTEDDIAKVDEHMETFRGRITRDKWVEQAGFLAKDDIAGFEAKFGKV